MKLAAVALVDMKTFSKGRDLFKRRKASEILIRRDEIMLANPEISQVGAYQKALKQLWSDADQDWWDVQASSVGLDFRNQKHFPQHLYASLRGLCKAGSLGNLELMTFYAFHDSFGQIESGVYVMLISLLCSLYLLIKQHRSPSQ
jgi:hypothetical protein